jgi:hypothetical protein
MRRKKRQRRVVHVVQFIVNAEKTRKQIAYAERVTAQPATVTKH